jgi:hypothetical protein
MNARIRVPMLGTRIAGLLSILLCVFSLELCLLNEHRAQLQLEFQEELIVRDALRLKRQALMDEIYLLRLRQEKLDKQIDIMMSIATRGGGWDRFVQMRRAGYFQFYVPASEYFE